MPNVFSTLSLIHFVSIRGEPFFNLSELCIKFTGLIRFAASLWFVFFVLLFWFEVVKNLNLEVLILCFQMKIIITLGGLLCLNVNKTIWRRSSFWVSMWSSCIWVCYAFHTRLTEIYVCGQHESLILFMSLIYFICVCVAWICISSLLIVIF